MHKAIMKCREEGSTHLDLSKAAVRINQIFERIKLELDCGGGLHIARLFRSTVLSMMNNSLQVHSIRASESALMWPQ